MFRLAEGDCAVAESPASRDFHRGLGGCLRLRRLQSGAHAEPDRCSFSGV